MSDHPAQFSPELMPALQAGIEAGDNAPVFDPFAGPGTRLAGLCDSMGIKFSGCDIETWDHADERVAQGDATDHGVYPPPGSQIVTSPTYGNGLNDHHEPKEDSRRFTYRVALERPLDVNNSGRYGIRSGRKSWLQYWEINGQAVAQWATLGFPVTVNTKAFIHSGRIVDLPGMWEVLLVTNGYKLGNPTKVATPGLRFGANAEERIGHEVVLSGKVIR